MKQILILTAILSLVFLQNSGFTETADVIKSPKENVKEWFFGLKAKLDEDLSQVIVLTESGSSSAEIQSKYREARASFKQIEFLISYLDPQLYNTYLNGAPLPKLMKKVPDITIIEPGGFQRLDELIYDEAFESDEIVACVQKLQFDLNTVKPIIVHTQLTDAVFFEATRSAVLRINTMGISGFDAPGNTDFALLDLKNNLLGIRSALSFYEHLISPSNWTVFDRLVQEGTVFVDGFNFENFDRLSFHKNYGDPLWNQLLVIQKELYVELPHQRTNSPFSVNYESESLFANDFLNSAYFGEYSGDGRDSLRIELGKLLFFDPVLSGNNQRACASCHHPKKAFTDGYAKSLNIDKSEGERNAPTIINSIYAERFFHDMRVDRLSGQVDHVVLNPNEFNSDYRQIIEKIKASKEYSERFKNAFGEAGISKNTLNHALTMYVASLRSFNSDFDKYMRGEAQKIHPSVERGYNLFTGKAACATCHFAPTFSGLVPPNFMESESEVLGVPKLFKAPYQLDEDQGRYMNRLLKEQASFYKNSFKTPTIRNVELTAPYMHNGTFSSLEDVLEFYDLGGGAGLGLDVPHQTLPTDKLNLTEREKKDLIAFMKSLTDTTGLTNIPTVLPKIDGMPKLNTRKVGGEY